MAQLVQLIFTITADNPQNVLRDAVAFEAALGKHGKVTARKAVGERSVRLPAPKGAPDPLTAEQRQAKRARRQAKLTDRIARNEKLRQQLDEQRKAIEAKAKARQLATTEAAEAAKAETAEVVEE